MFYSVDRACCRIGSPRAGLAARAKELLL